MGFGLDPATAQTLLVRDTSVLLDPDVHPGVTARPNATNQLAVNASGTIAYSAVQTAGVVGFGVYTISSAGSPVTVADPNDGLDRDAVFPSINASGRVAFVNRVRLGLFAGPNPATDMVIRVGHLLPGHASPVASIDFHHPVLAAGARRVVGPLEHHLRSWRDAGAGLLDEESEPAGARPRRAPRPAAE
jgi:hypothetical protein